MNPDTRFFTRNQFIKLYADRRNIYRIYTTKNEIPNELFDLEDFYNCKHKELKKIGIQVK